MLLLLLLPGAAAGQTIPSAASAPGFLTAYRFHLNAARLFAEDERFEWDAAFGGDIDIVDYGAGRLNFLADYAAVLGSERRRFDPNQSAYRLDGSATWRTQAGEVAAIFHHVSRHLSDREKLEPIDWNMLGVGYEHAMTTSATRIGVTARALRVLKRSQVDYTGEVGGGVRVDQAVAPRTELFAGGDVVVFTVAPSIRGRDRQIGGRFSAGVRLLGDAGALELFAAYERRIDADPFDGQPRTRALAGFRFVGAADVVYSRGPLHPARSASRGPECPAPRPRVP